MHSRRAGADLHLTRLVQGTVGLGADIFRELGPLILCPRVVSFMELGAHARVVIDAVG